MQIISLSPDVKNSLEKIIRANTSPIQMVFRAQIILLFARGECATRIIQTLNTSFITVRKWVTRFNQNPMVISLEDAPRSGRPPVIPAIVKCEVVKFACSDIQKTNLEDNHWTIAALQKSTQESTGVLVSRSEISRILNHGDLKPHKVEMWLHSPDPCFREKVNKIVCLYLDPPDEAIVLCVDEKSGMQAIERKKSVSSKGKLRIDHEYKRNGTQTLIGCFEVKTGKVFGKCGKTRKKEDIIEFMEAVALRYPEKEVYIIWDNLNIHHGYRWYEFNKRHGNRFHFAYTPVHGSWVNQIEIWFGILQRKVIRNGSFKSEQELKQKVLDFVENWNKEAHPFKWQFRGYTEKAA